MALELPRINVPRINLPYSISSRIPSNINLPEPLQKIIGPTVRKGSSLASTRTEEQRLYRFLGVPEDCTYEDVKYATERLKEKYADDRKMKIRIDSANERIFELQLAQRLQGHARATGQAAMVDEMEEAELANAKAPNTKFQNWLASTAYGKKWLLPDKQHFDYNYKWFLIPLVLNLIVPTIADGIQFFMFIICMQCIYMNDRPGATGIYSRNLDQQNQGRPKNAGELGWAALFSLGFCALGNTIAPYVTWPIFNYTNLPFSLQQIRCSCQIFTCFVGGMLMRVSEESYRAEKAKQELKMKKGGKGVQRDYGVFGWLDKRRKGKE